MTRNRPGLLRCSICRKWYRPDARAATTQKTCSDACRKKRNRKLAKRRREKDLHEFRVEERQRQRRSRMQRREIAVSEPDESSVSRAGFDGQLVDIIEEIVYILDKVLGVSRATLRRRLDQPPPADTILVSIGRYISSLKNLRPRILYSAVYQPLLPMFLCAEVVGEPFALGS